MKTIRIPIEGLTRCVICRSLGSDTASEFEFFCSPLDVWICETHCTEVQMPSYAETREYLAKLLSFDRESTALIAICAECEGMQP
jgi:hypothetical protein